MAYAPIPMVPGPTSVHPDALVALCHDYGSGDIEQDFLPLYNATVRNLQQLFGTKNDVVLMTGEGMLALWAALKSSVRSGDRVLCLISGFFGEGIADMAEGLGCVVERIHWGYNESMHGMQRVEEAIARFKPRMITAVHCETPSGTINPLEEVGALKHKYNVPLLYVDVVSSFGGIDVRMDTWHVDLILGGSQKCLSAPPSMCFVGVSPRAWECIAEVNYQGYDALAPFKSVPQDGFCPYTPYWHGMAAVHAASQALLTEGLEKVFARHYEAGLLCREGLARLGIALWPVPEAWHSPTITAAMIPYGLNWQQWDALLRPRGLVCSDSYGPMQGKVFRLGHMGIQASQVLIRQALEVLEDAVAAARTVSL